MTTQGVVELPAPVGHDALRVVGVGELEFARCGLISSDVDSEIDDIGAGQWTRRIVDPIGDDEGTRMPKEPAPRGPPDSCHRGASKLGCETFWKWPPGGSLTPSSQVSAFSLLGCDMSE